VAAGTWRRAFVAFVAFAIAACETATPPAAPSMAPTGSSSPSLTKPPGQTASAETPTPGRTAGFESPQPSGPPPAPDSDPTSADLIEAALAAGTIDAPTALLYRVYSTFSDLRLPEEYRTPVSAGDDWAMFQAQTTIDTLPPEIAAELRPFLARPTARESVFHGAAATSYLPLADPFAPQLVLPALGNPYGPGNFVCDVGSWGHIEGGTTLAGGPAWKVWGVCNDTASINDVVKAAGYMELLYGAEVALMGPPKPDTGGGVDEAGDGALDVYLISSCVSRAGRCMGTEFRTDRGILAYAQVTAPCDSDAAARCSSFIVIPRATIVSPLGASTVAHELFHTLEFNHNAYGLFASGDGNWFMEASSVWSEHYFYPAGRPAAVHPRFSGFQSGPFGLSDTAGLNEYDSYVWPLFMEQLGGKAKIAAAWQKIEGQAGNEAIDAAIDGTMVPPA